MSEFTTNHHYKIPRVALEFDPTRVGDLDEFQLRIPFADMSAAVALEPPLEYIPEAGDQSPTEVIYDAVQENIGGKVCVVSGANSFKVKFGFTPYPARNPNPTDASLSYFERVAYTLQPQDEHRMGRIEILQAIARITKLQYQYAIPPQDYTNPNDVPGARFSYSDGEDILEPRVVVTGQFDKVMKSISREGSLLLTSDAASYLKFLDPTYFDTRDDIDILSGVVIPNYGRIFSSGQSSLGQRDEAFTQEEIDQLDTERDYRLQNGDFYRATGHNLDLVSQPQLIAMVAIGSINRLCRTRVYK